MTERDRRRVAGWLLLCAGLVFAMVLVGGVTRLTRSGLSIVEWQPLVGALPPLSQADWEALFARYRETPEFRLVNFQMTLEGLQRHLLVGVPPPPARPRRRLRFPAALPLVSSEGKAGKAPGMEARGNLLPRSAAGRDGMDHGAVGPDRRPEGRPRAPVRAPRDRARDFRRRTVARAGAPRSKEDPG